MFFDFARFGDRVAVLDDVGNAVTYNELAEFALSLSNVLDRIESSKALCVNLCENSMGALVGYACMIESHIVPLMVDCNLDSNTLDKLLLDYSPEFLWLPDRLKDRFIRSGFKEVLGQYSYTLLQSPTLLQTLGQIPQNVGLYSELALLLSTSGSTGSSKMVRQSYENLQSNTESIIQYLHIDKTQRAILILPLHYTFGLSVINTHLYSGAMILLSDKSLMQKQLWEFIATQRASSISGVPYTYEMLKKLKFFNMSLPYLKTMTQAGGKLSIELHKEFATFAESSNKAFIVMYGQTEATARMSYLPSEKSMEKCGSIGVAIPNGEFYLLDSKGNRIEQDYTQGELIYKGKNVALGYSENRFSLAKKDEFGGVLHTGDIAQRDSEGYYYIVGRKNRFIKMFGKRINLDDIDSIIEGEFQGLEAKSSGVDDMLYIFITQEKHKEVKKLLCDRLKIAPTALKVKHIESLPRNSSGKILYSVLDDIVKKECGNGK